jgi:hypothetical protein
MGVREELKVIAKKHNNILKAADVVKYAENELSALHKCFEWNDGVAAEKYRLEQAENIIRVQYVKVDVEEKTYSVREWISPSNERGEGTYHNICKVLKSKSLKETMLEDAYNELKTFRNKYKALTELTSVHNAIGCLVD